MNNFEILSFVGAIIFGITSIIVHLLRKDLNLILDFSTGSSGQFFFIINGDISSSHSFILAGFSSTNFQSDVFRMNSTALANPGEHIVFVTLIDSDNQKVLALLVISVTFEP